MLWHSVVCLLGSDMFIFKSVEAGNFSLHHRVLTGSGVHRASYPMETRVSFPGGKAAGV
jgi:hypothetical protein